jgi:transcriptional repressor NrdR
MKCPYCGSVDTEVLESRIVEEGSAIRRRRKCLKCDKRFTTHERIIKTALWVIKKDGRREYFDREKIKRGVVRAVEKRPISMDLVDEVVSQVERELLKKGKQEVSSGTIGKAILRRLKKIDKVAWLRFASVYLEFDDLDDFAEAISTKENEMRS